MKKMTYATLMKKINDGYAEVSAWSSECQFALVTLYDAKGNSRRVQLEITNIPAHVTIER